MANCEPIRGQAKQGNDESERANLDKFAAMRTLQVDVCLMVKLISGNQLIFRLGWPNAGALLLNRVVYP